jgi:hypothetical protein
MLKAKNTNKYIFLFIKNLRHIFYAHILLVVTMLVIR